MLFYRAFRLIFTEITRLTPLNLGFNKSLHERILITILIPCFLGLINYNVVFLCLRDMCTCSVLLITVQCVFSDCNITPSFFLLLLTTLQSFPPLLILHWSGPRSSVGVLSNFAILVVYYQNYMWVLYPHVNTVIYWMSLRIKCMHVECNCYSIFLCFSLLNLPSIKKYVQFTYPPSVPARALSTFSEPSMTFLYRLEHYILINKIIFESVWKRAFNAIKTTAKFEQHRAGMSLKLLG